jgi:septum formation protein
MRKIVLASESPQRREILEMTGLKFTVCASDYEEELDLKLTPRALARFLSRKKAEVVAGRYKDAIIIAADTFIVFKGRLLGKPHTDEEAGKMLQMLNGRAHSVLTGFTIIDTDSNRALSRSVATRVYFKKLGCQEISSYVKSGEPLDKAGAYAIQGLGAALIHKIEGDYFNVVGLPLNAVKENLKKFGVRIVIENRNA